MDLITKTRELSAQLDKLPAPAGISHVYNPLAYMRDAHTKWLSRFVRPVNDPRDNVLVETTDLQPQARQYLILGMNPGPWGMVQTGIPFGDVPSVTSILGFRDGQTIPAPNLPAGFALHPQRPVQGFACKRIESSGDRLWTGLAGIFGYRATHAERLADVTAQCFALNYCPLAYFTGPAGVNVTPDEIARKTVKRGPNPYYDPAYVAALDAVCMPYLRTIMAAMDTRVVLAIGRYAERKAKIAAALQPTECRAKVVYLTHPSPLATHSAEQWASVARETMTAAGVLPVRGAV